MTIIQIKIEQHQDGRVTCTMEMPAKQSFLPAEVGMADTIGRWLADKFVADHAKLTAVERASTRVDVLTRSDFGGKGHIQGLYDLYTQSHYPTPLHGDQAEQVKSAFYAGALSNFKLLKDATQVDFKESVTTLTAIESELISYFKNNV